MNSAFQKRRSEQTAFDTNPPRATPASLTWTPPDVLRLMAALGGAWRQILLWPLVALVAAVIYLIASNPTYTISAQLMLRPGAELATPATVSVQTNQPNSGGMTRIEDVTAEVQIIKDPALVHAVVAELGEDFFFGDDPPQGFFQTVKHYAKASVAWLKSSARGVLVWIGLLKDLSRDDMAELMLQRALEVTQVTRSDIVELSLAYPDPVAGKVVLDTFLARYQARRAEIYRDTRLPDYFTGQLDGIATRLHETEDRYRDTRARLKAWSVEEQRTITVQRREKLVEALALAAVETQETEARLAEIDRLLAEAPDQVESSLAESTNPVVTDLHRQRIKLQLDLAVERRLRGEGSAQGLVLAQQLAEVDRFLDSEPARVAGDSITQANPIRDRLLADQSDSALKLATLRERSAAQRAELAQLEDRLHEVDAAAVDLARMERDLAQLRASQDRFQRGLQEARIATDLSEARISNLVVLAEPKAGLAPDKPRVSRVLMVVLVGALVMVMGWILLQDALHPRLRANGDIRAIVGPDVIVRAAGERRASTPEEGRS